MTRILCVVFLLLPAAQAQSRTVVAISHRGEHFHNPENTIPAFQEAIRVHADFIEVDVQTTSDGKLVLMHDGTVDRMTNATGPISQMTFDEIEKLDVGAKFGPAFAGTRVPTFAEVLDLARGKIDVYVDWKNAPPKDLVETIAAHGMSDHVVIYGHGPRLKTVQAIDPKLKIMPESENVTVATSLMENLHPVVVAFSASDFTAPIISIVKAKNALIYVDRMGLTDAPEGWQSAIDAGADGIQTDRPLELVQFLRVHGYKKP